MPALILRGHLCFYTEGNTIYIDPVMVKVFSIIVFLFSVVVVNAQIGCVFPGLDDSRVIPRDTSYLSKYKTIEDALGLPPVYTVKAFSFTLITKGEVFHWQSTWNSRYRIVQRIPAKGDKLIIENIVVVKDGVERKWMPKTFTF